MNREILFRGQRDDNGEEIEGYYCKFGWLGKEKHYIIPSDASACTPIEVDPNTICQYIGRTDKNGVKIFEGDVLDCVDRIVYVRWHDKCGVWDSEFVRYTDKSLCSDGILNAEWKFKAIKIGNIYDNPELLTE